jgi:DisA bacterial checkpoint controller nucleotide-binding
MKQGVRTTKREASNIVQSVCCEFFEQGVRYFWPDAVLSRIGDVRPFRPGLAIQRSGECRLALEWMGLSYHLEREAGVLSPSECRLLEAVAAVILTRYRILNAAESVEGLRLFEGLPEDRWVSAFLHPERTGPDVLAQAITVLRQSSLTTYESHRISTGVIVVRDNLDAADGVVAYNSSLMSLKRFRRLCDGLRTAFLVSANGLLLDLVDVERYARTMGSGTLPVPSADAYRAHCFATANGGNICLVLTPNGEIKIFAAGVQTLHFIEGRWHLTDLPEKYTTFREAVGESAVAERLFVTALNLAESRRGGLFVVIDEGGTAPGLVAEEDLLESTKACGTRACQSTRAHYLLCNRRITSMDASILENIAGLDGGVVLDRTGRLLAFGAILRTTGEPVEAQEGGRTTAALYASRSGLALKVSEDGFISFYRFGGKVWEM